MRYIAKTVQEGLYPPLPQFKVYNCKQFFKPTQHCLDYNIELTHLCPLDYPEENINIHNFNDIVISFKLSSINGNMEIRKLSPISCFLHHNNRCQKVHQGALPWLFFLNCMCTVILKCPLFWESSLYELNSIKIACKCVPLIKPKPIPIVFIWLKEGPLWPTSVHAQGPQLFVSKPKWHAPSIVVKKYYGAQISCGVSLKSSWCALTASGAKPQR